MGKKILAFILAVTMIGTMTACGSNAKDNETEDWDKESFEDLNEQYEKEQQEEAASKEEKKQAEQEAVDQITDFSAQDIYVEDIDPYEKNIFAVMGLDNDFPKPKNTEAYTWTYETWPSAPNKTDNVTGEYIQPVPFWKLMIKSTGKSFYQDYFTEVHDYLSSKSTVKRDKSNGMWDQYWIEGGSKFIGTDNPDSSRLLITASDTTTVHVEGTVNSVDFGSYMGTTPCPSKLSITIDSTEGAEGTKLANRTNATFTDIYSYDEAAQAFGEPYITYVGGEQIAKGSKVSIEMTVPMLDSPSGIDVYSYGTDYINATVTLVQ